MPFATRLLKWFDQHGRKHLPWQHPITPYRVWVSEIMLQQTQVETVIPYFEGFMARFNNVKALAEAPIDDVLHLWTGLGYYARARNLHKTAQIVVAEYGGEFPLTTDELAALPGIGRSTAAAITSIAYNQPTAILDGNVKRVLARHQAIAGWPGQTAVAEQLWRIAEANMAPKRCRDYTQAIMDLGATLCTRAKPACTACPINSDCLAYQSQTVHQYPGKKPPKDKPVKAAFMLLAQSPHGLLLELRPPAGIWGGLWCLPQFESNEQLQQHLAVHFKHHSTPEYWAGWRHTFSHYHLDITPVHTTLKHTPLKVSEANCLWYDLQQPPKVGLAAPVKKLIQTLRDTHQPLQKAIAL